MKPSAQVSTPTEIATQLGARLGRVSVVTNLSWGPLEDAEAFLQGDSHRGRFYIHLWPSSEGHLEGVQVLATPLGTKRKPLHLGYWRPSEVPSGSAATIASQVWATLVEQDRENQERDMYSWVPVRRLP
jgi:hypothetical protein